MSIRILTIDSIKIITISVKEYNRLRKNPFLKIPSYKYFSANRRYHSFLKQFSPEDGFPENSLYIWSVHTVELSSHIFCVSTVTKPE